MTPASATIADGARMAATPAAILAGGLATRLRPFTETMPKAMVDVGGRPFIDHQLDLLRRRGLRRMVLCLGYRGEQVEAHLGDGSTRGLELRYAYDGPELLGTGGALKRAAPLLGDVFWVLYGDSYMDIDYAGVLGDFLSREALGLMTVLRNDDRWDRSNVAFRGGRLLRYDKRHPTPDMAYIDYGAGLLRAEALDRIPAGSRYDLADLYHALVEEGALVGHEVSERFFEIGTPAALEETRRHLAEVKQP